MSGEGHRDGADQIAFILWRQALHRLCNLVTALGKRGLRTDLAGLDHGPNAPLELGKATVICH